MFTSTLTSTEKRKQKSKAKKKKKLWTLAFALKAEEFGEIGEEITRRRIRRSIASAHVLLHQFLNRPRR